MSEIDDKAVLGVLIRRGESTAREIAMMLGRAQDGEPDVQRKLDWLERMRLVAARRPFGQTDPPGYDTRLWSLRAARDGYAVGVDFAQGEATISKDGRRK